jgi:hypothetical protein
MHAPRAMRNDVLVCRRLWASIPSAFSGVFPDVCAIGRRGGAARCVAQVGRRRIFDLHGPDDLVHLLRPNARIVMVRTFPAWPCRGPVSPRSRRQEFGHDHQVVLPHHEIGVLNLPSIVVIRSSKALRRFGESLMFRHPRQSIWPALQRSAWQVPPSRVGRPPLPLEVPPT